MAFTTRKKRKRQLLLDCRQKYRTLVLELFPYELATSLLQHNNNQKARGQDYCLLISLSERLLNAVQPRLFATNVKSNRACYALLCYRAFYDVIGLYSILFIIIISHRVWWISSYLSVFKLIHTVIVSLLCLDPVSIGRVGGYSQPGGYSGSVGVFWWEHRGFRQRGYDDGLQSHSVHRQHWQGQRLVSHVSLFYANST